METFYPQTRAAWRAWLSKNHASENEIWLVTFRKRAGRPGVAYHEAVEEALCFGWIDSVRKSLGEDRLAQRFSPRRKGSDYSQTNRERMARLAERGLVLSAVLEAAGDIRPESFRIPDDILAALSQDNEAWSFFASTQPAYQRIRAAYVDHARNRPDEFKKRLENLIEKSRQGKHFGYGIEDFY